MIDYFKYTTGNAFTLSGDNYTGLFNITEPEFYGVYGENNLSFNSKENSMLELFSEIDKMI